ncbi:MAG: hypothetical protein LUI05_06590 [Oscillospiraceae bacterium]|nr:hypothetical protein [Oscillospiraceae bacterium]
MTAFIIIIGIAIIIFFLLKSDIKAELQFIGGEFDFKVKYLFFTVFPIKKKEKSKSERKKKSKSKKESFDEEDADIKSNSESEPKSTAETSSDDMTEENPERKRKKSGDVINNVKVKIKQAEVIWKSVKNALIRLFGGVHINNLMIDFRIGGEDACESALNYGKTSAVVYNAISVVRVWFPITVKTVDISCDFDSKESVYDVSLSVNLGLGTAIAILFTALFGFLKNKGEFDSAGKDSSASDSNKAA